MKSNLSHLQPVERMPQHVSRCKQQKLGRWFFKRPPTSLKENFDRYIAIPQVMGIIGSYLPVKEFKRKAPTCLEVLLGSCTEKEKRQCYQSRNPVQDALLSILAAQQKVEICDQLSFHFSNITKLESVSFSRLTQEQLVKTLCVLQEFCPNLRSLSLRGAKLSETALEILAKFPNLRHLSLRNTTLSPESAAKLAHLQVRSLTLSFTAIPDAGLLHLPENLHTLNLRFCQRLTDSACQNLARLHFLTKLNLSDNPNITGELFDALPRSITHLNLARCKKLWKRRVRLLSNLPLKKIDVSRTKVVEKIKTLFPDAKICNAA